MRLLLLDRDGVINHDSNEFIKSPQEWIPIDGSLAAIARATQSGYRVIVVSNQSGLARGLFDVGALNRIHAQMCDAVERVGGRIEAVFYCPHGPRDDCRCRKPCAGLLEDIGARLGADLSEAVMVGDKQSDLEAAMSAGARPILVKSGRGAETLKEINDLRGVIVREDLADAVSHLLDAN